MIGPSVIASREADDRLVPRHELAWANIAVAAEEAALSQIDRSGGLACFDAITVGVREVNKESTPWGRLALRSLDLSFHMAGSRSGGLDRETGGNSRRHQVVHTALGRCFGAGKICWF